MAVYYVRCVLYNMWTGLKNYLRDRRNFCREAEDRGGAADGGYDLIWTAHAQNLLVNGGFETPVLNPGETTRPEISAWGVLGTAYTAQAGAGLPDAPEGSQYLMGDTADFHVFQDAGTFTAGSYYVLNAWVYPTAPLDNVEIHAVLEETETWSGYRAAVFCHPSGRPSWKILP